MPLQGRLTCLKGVRLLTIVVPHLQFVGWRDTTYQLSVARLVAVRAAEQHLTHFEAASGVADNERAAIVGPFVARLKPSHGPQATSSYEVLRAQCSKCDVRCSVAPGGANFFDDSLSTG